MICDCPVGAGVGVRFILKKSVEFWVNYDMHAGFW